MDLYAIVDGDDPFYAMKLDSVIFGLPEQTANQYIQPLVGILQRIQNERIESFNEQLRRQQDKEEQKKREEELQQQEELRKQQTEVERKRQEEMQLQQLDDLLGSQKWRPMRR